tara:strand:+ start:135 stop:245 length:111 start_codon:yes stop_codon:yes gene_type:complete
LNSGVCLFAGASGVDLRALSFALNLGLRMDVVKLIR